MNDERSDWTPEDWSDYEDTMTAEEWAADEQSVMNDPEYHIWVAESLEASAREERKIAEELRRGRVLAVAPF